MDCPICKRKIKKHEIYTDLHVIVEEHAVCKDEYHIYGYEFVYGGYKEIINSEEFVGSYNDSDETRKFVGLKRDVALKNAYQDYKNKQTLRDKKV